MTLTNDDHDAIARRLADLLRDAGDGVFIARRYATTEQLCRELNISSDYAYDHKEELGAIALPAESGGRRGTLRWDMDVARSWFDSLRVGRRRNASVDHEPKVRPRQAARAPRRTLNPRPPLSIS